MAENIENDMDRFRSVFSCLTRFFEPDRDERLLDLSLVRPRYQSRELLDFGEVLLICVTQAVLTNGV